LIILGFVINDWVGVLEDLEVEEIFLYFERGKLISNVCHCKMVGFDNN